MGMYNQIVEVGSNVVKITTGGVEKEYNKTDLKCSATDIMVFIYYYTDSKNQIVASWNAYQADLYSHTLESLKTYIDGLLDSNKLNLSNINLGNVEEYASQADAISAGLINGDVYRLPKSSGNRALAIVNAIIDSYVSGTSTIDFTNNGGDDWDIVLKKTPDSSQLPSGYSIDSYDYIIDLFNISGQSPLFDGQGETATTKTLNVSGNGECVYSIQVIYNAVKTGSPNKTFSIWNLIKVDDSGNVLDFVKLDGLTVDSVSGLDMQVTANIIQSQNYPIVWAESPGFTQIGTGINPTLTLPIGTDLIFYGVTLGSEFSVVTLQPGIHSSVTIS